MSEQNTNTQISIKVKITRSQLYEFIMYNNYICFRGVISVLFSLISLVGTIVYWNEFIWYGKVLMLFMSFMFTVITPIEYYIRAGRQIKKSFQKEMIYKFDENGITIQINDDSSSLLWSSVMKVISTKNLVVVYFTPIRAFIIPKKDIGNNFESIREIMSSNTNCYKFKMEK